MNLILSTVHKLEYPALSPFLASLRRCRFQGEIVFFVSGVSHATNEKLQAAGVRTIPFRYFSIRSRHPILLFWPLWRQRFQRLNSPAARRALGRKVFNLFFLRWLLYEEFLAAEGHRFENVLMTDCRDVLFQGDPFAAQNRPGICFYLEVESQTVGACAMNQQMLDECFGPEVVAQLSSCRISCAGTTLGQTDAVKAYVRRMVEESFAVRRMALVPGADQGLHNYLVHRGRLPGANLVENGAGAVLTMGAMRPEQIQHNPEGEVVRRDGTVIPVLHQYDRHAGLAARLLGKLNNP